MPNHGGVTVRVRARVRVRILHAKPWCGSHLRFYLRISTNPTRVVPLFQTLQTLTPRRVRVGVRTRHISTNPTQLLSLLQTSHTWIYLRLQQVHDGFSLRWNSDNEVDLVVAIARDSSTAIGNGGDIVDQLNPDNLL